MQLLQFKITLMDTNPSIWRRIQISEDCTFWDLHVAIQDSMGWEDCHLHMFAVKDPKTVLRTKQKHRIFIGIPEDVSGDMLAGWNTKVKDYLIDSKEFTYEYDFGDSWEHLVEFEGYCGKDGNVTKYPICIDGEISCPPEDIGGIPGYYNYLEIMKNPSHPDHKEYREWYGKYDEKSFDYKKIKFTNPNVRLKNMMNEMC